MKEEIEIKDFIELLRVMGTNTFKIKLLSIYHIGNKIELKFVKVMDADKIYSFEIEPEKLKGEIPVSYKEYIASAKFDEENEMFVLNLSPVEKNMADLSIIPFKLKKEKSIEENFENFANYMNDEIAKKLKNEPNKLHYFASIDYLKPFVEDFVNKIQTDWIYANLDSRLALKSFALYLAEQKGLNIERFKYLKQQYINIDIMLGTIILKQKILDKYVKMYL